MYRFIYFLYFTLIFLAYLIPYTFLSRVHHMYGSFGFWVLFAIFCIVLLEKITNHWKDEN